MLLSDAAIRKAKPTDKPQKLTDGDGLYLLLNPNGSRWWRFRYRAGGKEKMLSLGTYPDTSLKDARNKRDAAREQLATGMDPAEQRKAARAASSETTSNEDEVAAYKQFANQVPAEGSLGALGVDEMEERAYRALLVHRMATAEDVATTLSLPQLRAQRLLDSIEAKGLATQSPGRPRRYIVVSPELAFEALASQRRADIDRACLTIPNLSKRFRSSKSNVEQEQPVEIINSRVVLRQIAMHMHRTVQHEIFGFQRLPMIHAHQEKIRSDMRVRSVSDLEYIESPGALDSLRHVMEMGEEARVFTTLPVKMIIADRRIGLVLNAGDAGGPVLLVRQSPLLDALCALFELIWERATPLTFSLAGEIENGRPAARLSEGAKQMIPQLAAGLHDKTIAFEAGLSATTLNRRIDELMKAFNARTRFQLGWCAALEAFPERTATSSLPGKPAVRRR